MSVHPLAGEPVSRDRLINVPRVLGEYYAQRPDPEQPGERVSFGTSGHRGSSLQCTFNEVHILAICQAIIEYRPEPGIHRSALPRQGHPRALRARIHHGARGLRRQSGAGHPKMMAASTQVEKEMFRRLLVQAGVAAGYLLRLEHREGSGRITTRIVQPVAYLAPDGASEAGSVVTRLADRTESTFPLDEVDHLSIASDHLPGEQVSRQGWTVGDPLRHAEFGFGVIQSFPAGDDVAAVARFARLGETALSLRTAPLERLRLTASGSGPE